MNEHYLEVTYRHGRPLAAYLYLERRPGDQAARTEDRGDGLMVDYADDGRAIGVEITAPTTVSLDRINAILAEFDADPLGADDLRPLARAG